MKTFLVPGKTTTFSIRPFLIHSKLEYSTSIYPPIEAVAFPKVISPSLSLSFLFVLSAPYGIPALTITHLEEVVEVNVPPLCVSAIPGPSQCKHSLKGRSIFSVTSPVVEDIRRAFSA